MTKRRPPKPAASDFHGSGRHVKQIIDCLEKVNALSGYHPYQIFDDWSQLVEACLETLPDHLTALAQTGQFAEDTPETMQLFERLRSRYPRQLQASKSRDAWSYFSQALVLLLQSAEPGLWGAGSYGDFDVGYMGPDILGYTYMVYASPNQAKAQIFTPWNIALMMGRLTIPDGERQVHERLKQACQHPDNLLAQVTLLAGLALDEPEQAQEWFFNRVLPAAWPTYQPLRVGDPAGCGSGVLLLAAAACFPAWAVRLGCVIFQGADIDPLCVRMAKINCALYALNGYYLKFAQALHPLSQSAPIHLPRSHPEAYRQAMTIYKDKFPEAAPLPFPTFADLFRRQPAEIELES